MDSVEVGGEYLRFQKPRSQNEVTRHLYIAGFRLKNKDDWKCLSDTTKAVLGDTFNPSRIHVPPGKPHVYVTFNTVEEATSALEHVNGHRLEGSNIVLYGSYAEEADHNYENLKQSKQPAPQLDTSNFVPGIELIPDFISEAEEEEILASIERNGEWEANVTRAVKHFGYRFNYETRKLDLDESLGPLPEDFGAVLDKCVKRVMDTSGKEFTAHQITVNRYLPGQGIPPHVETHSAFEETLLSLSLEADTVMDFRRNGIHKSLVLPRRSLLIMQGEGRYGWTHGIAYRKSDEMNNGQVDRLQRSSLTIRQIRENSCPCSFPECCDASTNSLTSTSLEREHVHDVYDQIAPHFSHTRYKPWPKIEEFLMAQAPGSLVADVGCGNGKYLGVNPQVISMGSDRSKGLLNICKDKGFDVAICDNIKLAYRDCAFDAVISIAVIHHFSTVEHRLQGLQELLRITNVGGRVLVYVWAFEQKERKFEQQDVLVPWHLQNCFTKKKGSKSSAAGDGEKTVVDESKQAVVYKRYYHLFKEGELVELVGRLRGAKLIEGFFDHANWCAIIEKTAI